MLRLPRGRRGTAYPDVGWEPKEAFRALAGYYACESPGKPAGRGLGARALLICVLVDCLAAYR
jgi:hypothetical protein